MIPSWIRKSKRQLDMMSAQKRHHDGRLNVNQKRLGLQVIISFCLLLFVSTSGAGRMAVLLSPLLFEFLFMITTKGQYLKVRWPVFLTLAAALVQLSLVLFLDRVSVPQEIRLHGIAPPPRDFPAASSGDPRVLVGPDGVVASPFLGLNDAAVVHAAVYSSVGNAQPYVTGDDFSVIIPVRNEDTYIARTVKFTLDTVPKGYIKEVIVVDDASDVPVADVLDKELPPKYRKLVKVFRFDTREGLIRARIYGADRAEAANIFFLDGHCKPKKGWIEPLLKHLKANYKRVACPVIQDIRKDTLEDVGTSGFKMMFEWNFEFGWYDDLTDEVPISAGGILAMTKRWWTESGKYDSGMLEWGGENLEQSMRIWMCGGEIFVVRDSFVGHIFDRPPKPNPGNSLVIQVQKNQKRGALLWLDEYYKYFERFHPVVTTLDEGPGLEERFTLRQRLNCRPFQWYVDKFRTAFERKGLLVDEYHSILHPASRWCLTAAVPTDRSKSPYVVLDPCNKGNHNQDWQAVAGGRMLYNRATSKCLDRGPSNVLFGGGSKRASLIDCDWNGVFKATNNQQFWQFDGVKTGRVFTYSTKIYQTLTGNDRMFVDSAAAQVSSSSCLSSDLHFWDIVKTNSSTPTDVKPLPVDIEIKPCSPTLTGEIGNWRDPQGWEWLW